MRVQCTGAGRFSIPKRDGSWHIVCSRDCYGPTGCFVEDTFLDDQGQLQAVPAARLALAGCHTSLLLAPEQVVRRAYAMLHVR